MYVHVKLFFFNYQELLNALHERHEEWLIQGKFPIPAPVMVSIIQLVLNDYKLYINICSKVRKDIVCIVLLGMYM